MTIRSGRLLGFRSATKQKKPDVMTDVGLSK